MCALSKEARNQLRVGGSLSFSVIKTTILLRAPLLDCKNRSFSASQRCRSLAPITLLERKKEKEGRKKETVPKKHSDC